MEQYDLVVIGAGPGGYVAAIRAAQLGLNVACVDGFKRNGEYSLGGTCLNVGCIPSKALLQSSENYSELIHSFGDHGISCNNPQIDIKQMLARKEQIIDKNVKGISYLFKKNKIVEYYGWASLANQINEQWIINIDKNGIETTIVATDVIIATGSSPRALTQIAFDNKSILDNQGALALDAVPANLAIIGAGVIGLEMGSVWSRLGSKVTILEVMPQFCANMDQQIAKELYKNLTTQQIVIKTGIDIKNIVINDDATVSIDYQEENQLLVQLKVDKLIVAIGRVPNTSNLKLNEIGLELDSRGFIAVDQNCKTNLKNIWAIGDVVRGPMLAHKASDEGICVAERIVGEHPHFNFDTIPWVIYTNPEVAWVGKTEEQLKQENISYKKGVAHFNNNGRAVCLGNNTGLIKILADSSSDRILGVHMIGPWVSELITEAVVAMEFKAAAEDLARIIHAHPSLSEVIHEAALACDQRQLHG